MSEQVATQMVRVPTLSSQPKPGVLLQRACSGCGKHTNGGECETCKGNRQEQERTGQLQRAAIGSAPATAPSIVHEVLRTPGHPLDAATRGAIEPGFGRDFSRVRVHTDAKSAESARAVNALAYTVGPHVVFGAGQYTPHTTAGQRLLAHELAHVMQQGHQPVADHSNLEVGAAGTHLEQEAESVASQVTQPSPHFTLSALTLIPAHIVQRQLITSLGQGGGFGGLMERDRKERHADPNAELSVPEAIQGGIERIKELKEAALRSANIVQRLAMLEQLINALWTGSSEEEAILQIIRTTPQSQAIELVKQLSEQKVGEKTYLKALDDVVNLGNNLELHTALSKLRLKAMGSKKGTAALTSAPVLPWHDVTGIFENMAVFTISTNKDGKVVVKYPTRVRYAKDFGDEPEQLPLDIFINGHTYEPDQVLTIHDYESGKFVPVVAQELIGYQHSRIRGFLGHVALVASFATPVSAARTTLGKIIAYLAHSLLIITSLIDENRLNLIKWFPKWGPRMIYFSDLAKIGVGIYGLGQFALNGYRFFASWKAARQSRSLLEGVSSASDAEKVALTLEKQADEIFNEVEKLQSAESAEAKSTASTPNIAQSEAGQTKSAEQLAGESESIGRSKDTQRVAQPTNRFEKYKDDQVRDLLTTDREAPFELIRRYRAKSQNNLRKLAKGDDETARIVLGERKKAVQSARAGAATLPGEQRVWNRLTDRLLAKRLVTPKTEATGTLAVAETDLSFPKKDFEGGSIRTGETPDPTYTPPTDFPRAQGHAEQNTIGKIAKAIREAGLDKVKGGLAGKKVWILVDQEVCTTCRIGLLDDILKEGKPSGVLKSFSQDFPELTIEVTDWGTGNVWRLQKGTLVR
jgi:hypothetical protein